MWLMIICGASYVKCEHAVLCFIQDDASFFFLVFPSVMQTFTSCASVLCLSPPPLSPLGWVAISGHAYNLILLMPLAPKDHLVRIGRVMCYFQDTQARSHFPCLPKCLFWVFFSPWFNCGSGMGCLSPHEFGAVSPLNTVVAPELL